MSIATLKKKTMHKYNNSSVGQTQFSLNGGYRSQGFVGQTSLSRSIIKTPMKGNVVKGHGGNNGAYQQSVLFSSDVTSLNDSSQMKSSVITTNGMIKQKYKWIKRPIPFSVFKPKVIDTCKIDIVKDKIVTSCSKFIISTGNPLNVSSNINCRTNNWDKVMSINRKTVVGTTSIGIKSNNGLICI
jgi:hypothetical protein